MSRGRARLPEISIASRYGGGVWDPDGYVARNWLPITAVPGNNQTVTIGGRVYVFKTILTGAANEVLIGGSGGECAVNLASAIIAGDGEGVVYGDGTLAHTLVLGDAGDGSSELLEVQAILAGAAGNLIACSETLTSAWETPTLTGGADRLGAAIGANSRLSRGWLIARRYPGVTGAIAIPNAYLSGHVTDDVEEGCDKFLVIGSMDIAEADGGRAVLVDGVGVWSRIVFTCDGLAGPDIDVVFLPIDDG